MKFDQRFLVWVMWNSSGILYFGQDLFVVLNFIPELNYTYFIPEWDFTCKHKFYHPMMSFIPGWDLILVSCKQLPKIEVQVDAKKKNAQACFSSNHHSSRCYSSCNTCSNNNVLSLLRQFITQRLGLPELLAEALSLYILISLYLHMYALSRISGKFWSTY